MHASQYHANCADQSKDGKSSESEAQPAKADTPPRKRADSDASETKSTASTKKGDDDDDAAAKKAALLERMSKMGHSMGLAPDGTPM